MITTDAVPRSLAGAPEGGIGVKAREIYDDFFWMGYDCEDHALPASRRYTSLELHCNFGTHSPT
jgi:hypothetical protein